jgi:hypothetical protein
MVNLLSHLLGLIEFLTVLILLKVTLHNSCGLGLTIHGLLFADRKHAAFYKEHPLLLFPSLATIRMRLSIAESAYQQAACLNERMG